MQLKIVEAKKYRSTRNDRRPQIKGIRQNDQECDANPRRRSAADDWKESLKSNRAWAPVKGHMRERCNENLVQLLVGGRRHLVGLLHLLGLLGLRRGLRGVLVLGEANSAGNEGQTEHQGHDLFHGGGVSLVNC